MNKEQKILSEVTVFGKYAKYIPKLKRRETWQEICNRYEDMMVEKYPKLSSDIIANMKFVRDKKVLPSMRAMQFAGKPIDINNSRIYNCAYMPIDDYRSFSEAMFLLLGGTGVGYSVQFNHIDKLPEISKPVKERRYLVGDSIEGWSDAVKMLMKAYFGKTNAKPLFDFRDIREKGARLVTSGGKAPGPEPLKRCLFEIEQILERHKNGEKLTSIECHDILCHIADAVLAGGIRRAAMIALFSFDDESMLSAKLSSIKSTILSKEHPKYIDKDDIKDDTNRLVISVEQNGIIYKDIILHIDKKENKFWDIEQYNDNGTLGWWVCNSQRGRANNSAVIVRNRIKKHEFTTLWNKIEASNAGEPGMYFSNNSNWGTNPCCEIALRPYQFCNLCEVNVSNIQSQEELNLRVQIASFFGTLQAGFTNFHYLRDIWKKTTEKDALVGVGMTGIGSGAILKFNLTEAAKIAKQVNEEVSTEIGIKSAARTTTIKPSGTSSCVLGTSSGIHAWHNDFYIRRQRVGKNEAICQYFLKYHPELIEDDKMNSSQCIITIPQSAPEGSILRTESALDLLERVKKFNLEWVKEGHRSGDNTNNVSATISINKDNIYENYSDLEKLEILKKHYNKTAGSFHSAPWQASQSSEALEYEWNKIKNLYCNDEWQEVGEWMWNNKETFNGLSVLPSDNGSYIQAPFEDITKEQYEEMVKHLSDIDLTNVIEIEDQTEHTQELACAGSNCSI